jgi:hypothetical protein
MRFRARSYLIAIAAGLLATGCGDTGITGPKQSAPNPAPTHNLVLASPLTVKVAQRDTPLTEAVTRSVYVSWFGGSLTLPGTGLTVIVPPFAVTRPITLTATAQAGSSVAYDFGPHGTHFNLPLVMVQDLTHVQMSGVNPLDMFAGYYSSVDDAAGTASITELLNLGVNVANLNAVFTVTHFSGYLIATGRCSTDSGQLQ